MNDQTIMHKSFNYCVLADIVASSISVLPAATKVSSEKLHNITTKSIVDVLDAKKPAVTKGGQYGRYNQY